MTIIAARNESDLADAANIRYLNRLNTTFSKTAGQMLSVTVDEEEHPSVYVHCSFPHTNRRIYLSIRTIENKEIGMIRSLDDFSEETAELLEEQVQIRYFAEITKVINVKEEFGYAYWEAGDDCSGYAGSRFAAAGTTRNLFQQADC